MDCFTIFSGHAGCHIPKKHFGELRGEIDEVKAKIASGEQPVFDSVDALFVKLEANRRPANLSLSNSFKNTLRI